MPNTDDKLNLLSTKLNKKEDQLNFKRDTLVGLQDGDTPITLNSGSIRESTPNTRFDTLELPHGGRELGAGKSKYSLFKQRESAASILNKNILDVTDQDTIDIANQQQIQRLSDIARSPGEERFIAPLIPNVEPTNLTGRYTDELGNPVNAPLNIPIGVADSGQETSGRALGQIQNIATGENLTASAAADENLNAFAPSTPDRQSFIKDLTTASIERRQGDVLGRVGNTFAAFAASAGKEIAVDTADYIGETLNRLGDIGYDLGDEATKTELVNNFFGYDSEIVNADLAKAKELGSKITDDAFDSTKDVDFGDVGELIWTGIKTPELAGTSLGYLAGTLIGFGKATAIGKAAKGIQNNVKSGAITNAEGLAQIKAMRKASSTLDKTKHLLASNAGLLNVAAGNVNDQLDEFSANNAGKEASIGQVVQKMAIETVMVGLDRFTDVSILKSPSIVTGLREAAEGMSQRQISTVASAIGGKIAGIVGAMGKEAAQEYTQEMGSIFNTQFGTDEYGSDTRAAIDILSNPENIAQGVTGAGLGAGGAVQFKALGAFKSLPNALTYLEETGRTLASSTSDATATPESDTLTRETDAELNILASIPADETLDTLRSANNRVQNIVYRLGRLDPNSAEYAKWEDTLTEARQILSLRVTDYKELVKSGQTGEVVSRLGSSQATFDLLAQEAETVEEITELGAELSIAQEQIARATEIFSAKKLADEVEEEVQDGSRGINTYLKQLDAAVSLGDTAMYSDAVSKLTLFSQSQSNKADVIDRTAQTILEQLTAEGSIEDTAGLTFKNSKKTTAEWGTGKIEVNWSDVAKKSITGNSRGALSVADKARASSVAMNRIIELTPQREQTAEEIQSSTPADPSPTIDTEIEEEPVQDSTQVAESVTESTESTPEATETIQADNVSPEVDLSSETSPTADTEIDNRAEIDAVKELLKTRLGKPDEFTLEDEQTLANASEDGILAIANAELVEEVKAEKEKRAKRAEATRVRKEREAEVAKARESLPKEPDPVKATDTVEVVEAKLARVDALIDRYETEVNRLKSSNKTIIGRIRSHKAEIKRVKARKAKTEDFYSRKFADQRAEGNRFIRNRIGKILDMAVASIRKFKDYIDKNYQLIENYNEVIENNDFKIDTLIQELSRFRAVRKDLARDVTGTARTEKTLEESISKRANSSFKLKGEQYKQETDINKIVGPAKTTSKLAAIDLRQNKISPAIRSFVAKSTRFVKDVIAPASLKSDGNPDNKELFRIKDSLGRGLLFNKKGEINANTAVAIAIAANEYMSYTARDTLVNTTEDIARMLGVLEYQVTPEQVELLQNAGTFKKLVATDLGKAVLSNLGLKGLKDASEETVAKLVADLGQMALAYMERVEYIEPLSSPQSNIPINDYRAIIGENSEDTGTSLDIRTVPFVKARTDAIGDLRRIRANTEAIIDTLAIEVNSKRPRFSKAPSKVFEVKNNDVMEVPAESQDLLNKMQNEVFTVNTAGVKRLRRLGRDKVMELLGYVEDIGDLAYLDNKSQEAKNREIEKSVDELFELDAVTQERKNAFYFNWFFSRNGRFMVDSNTVNPQTDKLHRFLVTPKKHGVTVDTGNVEQFRVFRLAIAQAFGFAIDKKSTSEALRFADVVLQTPIAKLTPVLNQRGAEVEIAPGYSIEVEELGHTIQGIEAVTAYRRRKGDTFDANITLELDAVTSGFIIKLMQMPLLSDTKEWLAKGGVFTNDYDGYNDIVGTNTEIEDGLVDAYKTLAGATDGELEPETDEAGIWDELKKFLPTVVDEEGSVTKDGRELFKYPFMTFNYGSSLTTIRKSLATNMLESLPNDFLTNNESNALKSLLIKNFGAKLSDETIRNTDIMKQKLNNGQVLGEVLGRYIDETYGDLVVQVFTDKFSEMVEANRQINTAFKYMFRAYNLRYNAMKAEFLGKNGRDPSSEEKIEIFKQLRSVFPAIKAPFSDGLSDSVAINDNRVTTRDRRTLPPAQTHLSTGKSIKVDSLVREFEESVAAGGVIPIHYIDGSLISKSLIVGGVIGVHDAILPSINDAVSTNEGYNNAMYDINKEYSFIKEIAVSLQRVTDSLSSGEKAQMKVDTFKSKTTGGTVKITLDSVNKKFQVFSASVEARRKELFDQEMKIDHMTGLDAIVTRGSSLERTVSPKMFSDIMQVMKKYKDCKNGM